APARRRSCSWTGPGATWTMRVATRCARSSRTRPRADSCCSPPTTQGRSSLPNAASSSAAAVWAILRKECRSEWRTRYGLNAALLFAVATLTSVSFAVGRLSDRADLLSALLWVVLLFATLASLSHAFVSEVEGHTLTLLRLVASPTAIAL